MTRLLMPAIKYHENHLCAWQTPAQMAAYVEIVLTELGPFDFFGQAGLAFLRNAWTAARFGILRNQRLEIRLTTEQTQWPDFQVRNIDRRNHVQNIECAEAIEPNRKRANEYKLERGVENDPVENWEKRAAQIPAELTGAVRRKLKKNYCVKQAELLIYLNIGTFGTRQNEIEASMPDCIAPALAKFNSVWIIWDRLYGPWGEGS